MIRFSVRRLVVVIACVSPILAAAVAAIALRITVNVSPSMPYGLYRLSDANGAIVRGETLLVCPPRSIVALARERRYLLAGPCDGDVAALIKIVAAVAGDVVDVGEAGVSVDGRLLPHSRVDVRDEAGRPLPLGQRGRHRVPAGSVWLYTPTPISFDSRYYGSVPIANVRARATLVWQTSPWGYTADLPSPPP